MEKEQIKVGDCVLVEQAWEDEAGNYHDAYAEVLAIVDGEAKLKFDEEKIDDFLRDTDGYKIENLEKA